MYNAPKMPNVITCLVVGPKDDQTCQEGHQTVEDKHAPIRQCLLREIPVGKFLKEIHELKEFLGSSLKFLVYVTSYHDCCHVDYRLLLSRLGIVQVNLTFHSLLHRFGRVQTSLALRSLLQKL